MCVIMQDISSVSGIIIWTLIFFQQWYAALWWYNGYQTCLLVQFEHILYTEIFSLKLLFFKQTNQDPQLITNISRHILRFVCFPVQNMSNSGFLIVHVSVLWPLAAAVLVSLLSFLLSWHWILRQFKVRLVFVLQGTSVCHFSRSPVEIVFRLFSQRTKWNRKELMGKVPKQWRNKCSCQDTNLNLA